MKKYIREIQHNGYKTVTEVDEFGGYCIYSEYTDGNGHMVRFGEYKTSIFAMGWSSLEEFIKNKMQNKIIIEAEG